MANLILRYDTSLMTGTMVELNLTGSSFVVDWKDGTVDNNLFHTYSSDGVYDIEIQSVGDYSITIISNYNYNSNEALTDVLSWDNSLVGLSHAFEACPNLISVPEFLPNRVSDLSYMFFVYTGGSSFNQDLSTWDTSNVSNMKCMFYGATSFNRDLSTWDTSNVTNMTSMFSRASSFKI